MLTVDWAFSEPHCVRLGSEMVQHRRQLSTTHRLYFWDHLDVTDVGGEGLLLTVAAGPCPCSTCIYPPFRRLMGQPVTTAGAELARGRHGP